MTNITLQALVDEAQSIMKPELYTDYCPNGLQVEGRPWIAKLVSGVTACQELLDSAVNLGADAVLVHHGLFWKNEDKCITGMKKKRIATLLNNDISLLAYHLPLDGHPKIGNNALLAMELDFNIEGDLHEDLNSPGSFGRPPQPMTGQELSQHIAAKLNRTPLYIPGASKQIKTIAWCTGAAGQYIHQALKEGVDAYLTGEITESIVHIARETGIHLFVAGHHATERYGVKAFGHLLARNFGFAHSFVDIKSPI